MYKSLDDSCDFDFARVKQSNVFIIWVNIILCQLSPYSILWVGFSSTLMRISVNNVLLGSPLL